jgi:hypothetical protein
MRARRIVIPGVSVVERMAAEAINQAETDLVTAIDGGLGAEMRQRLDALIDDKVHDRQSRLSWLREPEPRVASASLLEIVEKITVIRGTGISACSPDARHEPRLAQFAREGVRYGAGFPANAPGPQAGRAARDAARAGGDTDRCGDRYVHRARGAGICEPANGSNSAWPSPAARARTDVAHRKGSGSSQPRGPGGR